MPNELSSTSDEAVTHQLRQPTVGDTLLLHCRLCSHVIATAALADRRTRAQARTAPWAAARWPLVRGSGRRPPRHAGGCSCNRRPRHPLGSPGQSRRESRAIGEYQVSRRRRPRLRSWRFARPVPGGDSDLLWQRGTHVGALARAASSTEPTAGPDAPSSSDPSVRWRSAWLLLPFDRVEPFGDWPTGGSSQSTPSAPTSSLYALELGSRPLRIKVLDPDEEPGCAACARTAVR
jgi:hypothetical protein